MIASLVLSLREGLEAALIIGIVLGALRRTGHAHLNRYVWAGVAGAGGVSLLTAFLLRLVDQELEGTREQIFEGVTLLLAAAVLTWMIFWMGKQASSMRSNLDTKVSQAANLGGRGALFFLAFFAVLREGIELALYLTASAFTSTGLQTLLGTSIGLFVAAILGYLLYTTTLRLNLKRFFQITAFILIFFAGGLIAHSVAEFNEAGVIPAIISPIWNLNPLLNDHSSIGMIFSTLFGYHGSPSLTEVIGYSIYVLAALLILFKPRLLRFNKLTPPV
ncbi:MAG: iron permease [Anaerolineales bacterium]|nr:iron permease [Anaerolineae bacterium]PWB55745.1 MAG: iron permease [Anaerolineales bacterium]